MILLCLSNNILSKVLVCGLFIYINPLSRICIEWDSYQLQEALNGIGLPATIAMTRDEWNVHPQGQAIFNTPVIEITKIAEGKPVPFSNNNMSPLNDINLLDFTHVLAGPRCGMAFAELEANV